MKLIINNTKIYFKIKKPTGKYNKNIFPYAEQTYITQHNF